MHWFSSGLSNKTMFLLFLWISIGFVLYQYAFTVEVSTRSHQSDSWGENNNSKPNVDFLEKHLLLDLSLQNTSNLPNAYWYNVKYDRIRKDSCTKFPDLFDLEFNNIYWQILRSSNGTFYLFSAYYDNRTLNLLGPTVRILGMIDRIEPQVRTYCQLWFPKAGEAVTVPIIEYKHIWNKYWNTYEYVTHQPYLLTCRVPKRYKHMVPLSVSIVERPCHNARNNIRVVNDRPAKKGEFAVCVKGLDFLHQDMSVRFVEWIELLGILGAEKVFVYNLQSNKNLTKVLNYYQTTGQVDTKSYTLPGTQPNLPGIQHIYNEMRLINQMFSELIPYNDCLYRNLNSYTYISLLDVDEIIIPKKKSTWKELMNDETAKAFHTSNRTRASFNVRNIFFLDNERDVEHIPKTMNMLRRVYRIKHYSKPFERVKSFHDPQIVLTAHNHLPLACLDGPCYTHSINTTDAHLQHYRDFCDRIKDCKQERANFSSVVDTAIWKYKDELIHRVKNTLSKLEFIAG